MLAESDLGRVAMTTDAIAAIAGRAVDESFGVVDQAGRRGPLRLLTRGRQSGVRVRETDGGIALELHVVVAVDRSSSSTIPCIVSVRFVPVSPSGTG